MMKRKLILIFLLLVCIAGLQSPAFAKSKTVKNGWVKKNGTCYYYQNGKKLTGLKKIGTKYFYFDKKGIQKTGWRKIKKDYYFFQIKKGKQGYMVCSRKVNGIQLKKSGKASVKTARNLRKAKLLVHYQEWADKLTKRSMTKKEKLLTVFNYLRKNLLYVGSIHLDIYAEDFVIEGAEYIYDTGTCFECHTIACATAYLANAIGYEDIQICAHSGHGWVEIEGLIYDTSLSRHNKSSYPYFATSDRDGQEWPKEVIKDMRE